VKAKLLVGGFALCVATVLLAGPDIAVTIKGKVLEHSGLELKPTQTYLIASKPDPAKIFLHVADSASDENDGTYTLAFSAPVGAPINVDAQYAAPFYFATRVVQVPASGVVDNLDFTLPVIDKAKVSIEFSLTKTGAPIDRSRDPYTIVIYGGPDSDRRYAVLTDADFKTDGDKACDLPPGDYNVVCTLVVDGPTGPLSLIKNFSVKVKANKTEKIKIEYQ
jgi:hypothetical protein